MFSLLVDTLISMFGYLMHTLMHAWSLMKFFSSSKQQSVFENRAVHLQIFYHQLIDHN